MTDTPIPHNPDAEKALLGALIARNDLIGDVVDLVSAEKFYFPAHQHIFDAIVALHHRESVADAITISEHLTRNGLADVVGDGRILLDLVSSCATPSAAAQYARVVADNYTLREIIAASADIREIGHTSPDVEAAVDQARTVIEGIEAAGRGKDISIGDAVDDVLDQATEAAAGDVAIGNPTGLPDLDALLGGGLRPGTLNLIAGRPGSGKSALAAQIAAYQALHLGLAVYFVSLEMTATEIAKRIIAGETGIEERLITSGQMTNEQWDSAYQASKRLKNAKLRFLDPTSVTISAIRNGVRTARNEWGRLDLIVIDYLQLLSSGTGAPFKDRQLEVAAFSRSLKIMSREFDSPVLALSQLSRALETRGDKRPILSDLRESGSLEQDSDTVWATFRPAMYDETADPTEAEVIVLKQRNGPTGIVHTCWDGPVYRFLPGPGTPGATKGADPKAVRAAYSAPMDEF